MKLLVTFTSPYARMARVALIEHGLQREVEVIAARTRETDSPYYAIAPSGRVPFLQLDDGRSLEESDLICAYFDQIGSGPQLARSPASDNWEYGRLHALARSYVDGASVWSREIRRPTSEQSPTIIAHEEARTRRLTDVWEREMTNPVMTGAFNMVQLTLYCALCAMTYNTGRDATPDHPKLQQWQQALSVRPSIAETAPPQRKT